jgi:hypothetical protein
MPPITEKQLQTHRRLQNDLKFFARTCLQIKLKEGGIGPFVFNKAQEYLHERIEKQLAETGMVRMFILKGRQQGISTYIAARLYHKATRNKGKNVFILSHHSSTTETLFQIVEKYHEHCPPPARPEVVTANNRRLKFTNKSQYTVGTAGSGSIGRGDTNQYFHWSEVAFSDNIPELLTGVSQTVADVPGTEKHNESTANGVGNYFHRGCMDALAGKSRYELVFIPWYWQDEYRAPVPHDFRRTEYEHHLVDTYGIDDEQLQWRRFKIEELKEKGDGETKFKQEYPFTVREAFQSSGDSLISGEAIDAARNSDLTDPNAPYIIGVDPARDGDRTVFVHRRGREIVKIDRFEKMNEMLLSGKLANLVDKVKPDKVFVDVTGGTGNGAVDRLHELGYREYVTGVKFSTKASDDRYANKRAEMAGLVKEWLEDERGASIPDDEEFGVELGMIPAFEETSNGKLQLIAKKKIKEEYGKSPDLFDAAKLTFAHPVRQQGTKAMNRSKMVRGTSPLSVTNRRKQIRTQREEQSGWARAGSPTIRKR